MQLRVPVGNDRFLSLINVYAPTMAYSDEAKESFYQDLAKIVDDVSEADKLLILGRTIVLMKV